MSKLFRRRTSAGANFRGKLSLTQQIRTFFTNHIRQALTSLGEISQHWVGSVMTIAVLGLSLTLPSTFYVLVKNTEALTQQWQQATEINLFLTPNTASADIQQLIKRVSLWPEVENIHYISAEQGLEAFKQQSGLGDVLMYLDSNPLPDVIVVTPQAKHMSATAAKILLNKLTQQHDVDYGQLDVEWLNRLHALIEVTKELTIAIASVLFLAVVLIVGNTIRLNILNKKTEILVMKLVGATNGFIQRPFLYTGFWFGLLGGVCAWVCVGFLLWWIQGSIDALAQQYQHNIYLSGIQFSELLVILAASITLGLTGSYVAVTKHIKEIEPR